MAVQTLQLAGRHFVILPRSEYTRLKRKTDEGTWQDEGDVAEALRRKAKGPSRPYSELRKKLGLS